MEGREVLIFENIVDGIPARRRSGHQGRGTDQVSDKVLGSHRRSDGHSRGLSSTSLIANRKFVKDLGGGLQRVRTCRRDGSCDRRIA